MSEEELLNRCQDVPHGPMLYWVSAVYGFGGIIREYGYFPRRWPLNLYLSHGVSVADRPAPHEFESKAPVMLFFSQRLVRAFKNESSKRSYCIISPNVYYRRSRGIRPAAKPKGTLAFLTHTTPVIDDKLNLFDYAQQLKSLPEKFQPVTVCLHYHDVNKGVHKVFYELGLDVVTVGNPLHERFIERFYEIIREYRYTTSNEVGSYTFYSTEMGIPFFIYGSEPILYNNGDPNIEAGKYESYKTGAQYKKVRKLFEFPVEAVTEEQRALVEKELGVYDSVSRAKMALILYSTYLRYRYTNFKIWLYRVLTFRWLTALVKNKLLRLRSYFSTYKKYGFNFAKSFYSYRKSKSVALFGHKILYTNEFWFLHGMQEIFHDKTYWFTTECPNPLIIDCGSNIGLSIIYFKRLYKDARIIGFEPDPLNFSILQKNISSFQFSDVQIHNKAIWRESTTLQFASSESSVGSKLVDGDEVNGGSMDVEAVALSKYLKGQVVDFLKIDIEGAELEVIKSCKDYLKDVKNLFIEYHSLPNEPQQLHDLLQIIHESGFRYYLKEAWENIRHPYVYRKPPLFDLQLNIFAYR